MDASLSLIFGLPGQGALLRLDTLSLFFCVILLPQIIASAVAGMRGSVGFWFIVAGMGLTVLAGTVFALILGVGVMGVASWCMVAREDARLAARYAGIMVFTLICLVPALLVPIPSLAFVLVLLATGVLAGLVPFYGWLPGVYAALPEPVSALMSGGALNLAFYILIRCGFITEAGAQQPWWGLLLLVLGALSLLIGALKAALEVDLRGGLNWSTIAAAGLIAMGIGIALLAKALDNQALTGLALQAALLGMLAHGLFKPLLCIGAGEVRRAVGTTSLNWLGGLMRGMPRLGGLMALGAAGLALLPLGPAFAPLFLLTHALVGMAARGGIPVQFGCAVLLASLGLGMALLLATAVKIIGLGFLGRPRSLHAAAAEDIRHGPFLGMALLGILSVPIALVPGIVLFLCAPVIETLAPLAQTAPLAYTPLTLCLLAGLALVAAVLAQMRWSVRGLRETPAWNGGFGAPPAWLPFGDPHTQSSASGFVAPLVASLGPAVPLDPAERFLWRPLKRLYRRALGLPRRAQALPAQLWLVALFAALLLVLLVFTLAWGG